MKPMRRPEWPGSSVPAGSLCHSARVNTTLEQILAFTTLDRRDSRVSALVPNSKVLTEE